VKYYAVRGELAALVFEEAPKNLDAVIQAARLCDSVQW
jgi:type-2 restriction enzyme ageI